MKKQTEKTPRSYSYYGTGLSTNVKVCMSPQCLVPKPVKGGKGRDGAFRCAECVAKREARMTA